MNRNKAFAFVGGAGMFLATLAISTSQPAVAVIGSTTLTYGTVTLPNGTPVQGASIKLLADPYPMPGPGEVAQLATIDSTVTDANGHYILNLPASFSGSGVTDPSTGLVTFDVMVNSPSINTMSSLQATSSGQPAAATKVSSKRVQRTNFAGHAMTTATTDPNSEAVAQFLETEPEPAVISYADTPDQPNADGTPLTTVRIIKDYGLRWTAVGQWFSTATKVQADFRYTSGSSSSLGIGVSASGSKGTFSSNGTSSVSSSSSVGFPTVSGPGGWLDRTQFRYKLYRYGQCDRACLPYVYKAEPSGFAGGTSQPSNAAAPSGMNNCVVFLAGSTFDKHSSRAITWTNGVHIGAAIGIDLSAQTGYSTDADLHVTFNTKRRLCGRGDPGSTPYVLTARLP